MSGRIRLGFPVAPWQTASRRVSLSTFSASFMNLLLAQSTPPAAPAPPAPPAPPFEGWAEFGALVKELAQAETKGDAPRAKAIREQIEQKAERLGAEVERSLAKTGKANPALTVQVDGSSRRSRHSGGGGDGAYAAIPIVFIIFLFMFLMVNAITKNLGRRAAWRHQGNPAANIPTAGFAPDEQALVQKMGATLTRMESRVEALETILADPRRTASFTAAAAVSSRPAPSTSYESKA